VAESRGIDVFQREDTSVLILVALVDAARAKISSGVASYRLWHVLPGSGSFEAFDFADAAFKTGALATPTAPLAHQAVEGGAYGTGAWTARFTNLGALEVGHKYVVEVTHPDLPVPVQVYWQYGGVEGEAASNQDLSPLRASNLDHLDVPVSTLRKLLEADTVLDTSDPGQFKVRFLERGTATNLVPAKRLIDAAGNPVTAAITPVATVRQ
jgi:hypothetical protein